MTEVLSTAHATERGDERAHVLAVRGAAPWALAHYRTLQPVYRHAVTREVSWLVGPSRISAHSSALIAV